MFTSVGSAVLQLSFFNELKLVTVHYAIQLIKGPIKSPGDLMKMYPNHFDKVGKFFGEFHMALKTNSDPHIHAPRKCLIHLEDEIKVERDYMLI